MNIYVGNLPFTITEDKLKDLFVGFGEVTSINRFCGDANPIGSRSRH